MKVHCNALITSMVLTTFLFAGCASRTRDLDPDQQIYYDASYDFSDKKRIVDHLVGNLLVNPLFAAAEKKPIIVIYPVANETTEHIDTGGISDDIRRELLQANRFRFINERQRNNIIEEMGYQSKGYVDPSMQVKMGRQLGADYILSGTLRSIKKFQPRQWRVRTSERIYYSLDISITDLRTAEIVYADQAELAREASRPIIGW